MSLVVVGGSKGSPGATTLAMLLAAEYARDGVAGSRASSYLVDADPSGGDIAMLLDLDPVPGVATLALEGRHGITTELLDVHAQRSPMLPGVHLVPGIAGPAQGPVLEWLASPVASVSEVLSQMVVVDAGRLAVTPSSQPILEAARAVVLVCRSDTASLVHARSALAGLACAGPIPIVAVIGRGDTDPEELANALGHPLAGVVPLVSSGPPWHARLASHRGRGAGSFRPQGAPIASCITELAAVVAGRRPAIAYPATTTSEIAPPPTVIAALAAMRRRSQV